MTISPLVALIAGAAIQSSAASSQPVGHPPIQITVQTVSVERTIAEFMDVCFRPKWNVKDVRKALKEADPTYAEERGDLPNASAWDSTHAHLALIIMPQLSQCALSMASDQPRTGNQLLAMLRPAVEAELGHSVQENDAKFYLVWADRDSGYIERIALALATTEPSQHIWYVFDKYAQGSREDLERLTPPPKPSE